jgi:hypothetical protein
VDEQLEEAAAESVGNLTTGRNRSWFQPGDRRINRESRPYGTKANAPAKHSGDLARRTDRLMRLYDPLHELAFRLTHPNAFWIVNLPPDFEIVDSRVDLAARQVVFITRSAKFVRIARGTPIPEFPTACHGLMWHRKPNRPDARCAGAT